ncbi:MAG TPA: ABC transporter ATP-binding protein [Vicinamibacterales bacterium]|nr:ABC transporter ATP-binding protein [Vicinamibacterales bacterium]
MAAEIPVHARNLKKRYGTVEALKGVSFDIGRGEMFGLIGPDGAGKTTTIRLLCGLLHPDEGEITMLGRHPITDHRAMTASVGYLSQRFSLYGDLTIDENIAFFAEIHGVGDYAAKRNRLLDMTQLTPFRQRLADKLSGGMKQKLALACTLVHEPDIILLDEPTTGVDPVSRREFWKLLSQFVEQGITILMSTPYLDEAERCHRIAMLHEGEVLALDAPGRLRASLPGSWFEVVIDQPRHVAARLDALADGPKTYVFGDRLHVWDTRDDPAAARAALDRNLADGGLSPRAVRPIAPSLEDVFIARITGSATS